MASKLEQKKRFGVAIIGGTGYGAGELLRTLSFHPEIEVAHVVSRSQAGAKISAVHSHLLGISDLTLCATVPDQWWTDYEAAAIVCSMPSGQAPDTITSYLKTAPEGALRCIDLSGDLRLRDAEAHTRYYPDVPFAADVRQKCVYGLSELARDAISQARYVANPGCLATATILALAPVRGVALSAPVVVDAKTGTSGAGREPQTSMHHPGRAHDFTAYKVLEHRHEPEILQCLGAEFTKQNQLMFVPHLIPVSRGIFVSCYLTCATEKDAVDLTKRYEDLYRSAIFVRLRQSPPRLVDVVGTNFCDLHLVRRGAQIVVMAATDNLGKGMAGQCIQNLNLMFGLPEDLGLRTPALGPV
jgi:N-acetyl-gamma-glutamyl-phosphate reductase common form